MIEMKILKNPFLWFLRIIGTLIILVTIVPLFWPVAPLENVEPVDALKDSDSQFIDINGINVHFKKAGTGEPYFILLHGFGASLFSWREIISPLSMYGTVIAYDRPAFGLTDRPLYGQWSGKNPYSTDGQVDMLFEVMDAMNIPCAILIGNSAGGTIAVLAALQHPNRVKALVEVDAAIFESGNHLPVWVGDFLFTPQADRMGPVLMRSIQNWGVKFLVSAWHDPEKITKDILQGYQAPLHAPNWDKALFELLRAPQSQNIESRLSELQMPVLVISGDDDHIVPPASSIRLADAIASSTLAIIPNSGHVPQEEQPSLFMQVITDFVAKKVK
jgi:pimeloyl-ACP methyl ester carboxylesterase